MEKITKKRFVEILAENPSAILANVRRAENSENAIRSELENISEIPADRRTVRAIRSNHIEFSNGSRFYFDQDGEKEYFSHENDHKIGFVGQKLKIYDRFDEKNYEYYMIYAIA